MGDINREDFPSLRKKDQKISARKLLARGFWSALLFGYDILCVGLAFGVEKKFLQEPPRQYVGFWRDIRLTTKGGFAITISTAVLGLAMSAFVVVHAK